MKKLSWGRLSVLALSVTILFTACSKDGKDGKDGTNGTNGAQGPAGTANVYYSGWIDANYVFNTTDSLYEATISAPKLVDSILQKGEMKAYMNFGSTANPDIYPLPIGTVILVEYKPQTILLSSGDNWSTAVVSGSKVGQVRYILIPGGTATGRSAIDWNNYAEVKQYLGLKD